MSQIVFQLDGAQVTAQAGESILVVARREGVEIPTLCHHDDHSPAGACLVCLVLDRDSGRMLPSCATPPMEGQRIETTGPAVLAARRRSVELLLGDHAGDCEAPCSRVCPEGLDIPRAIQSIQAGAPVLSQPCLDCAAPCERACRRRLHDGPVAIRPLMLHGRPGEAEAELPRVRKGRFDSRIGALREGEIEAMLRGASPAPPMARGQEGRLDPHDATREARRCMRCDCREKDACRLRAAADDSAADPRRFGGPIRTPITRPDAGARLAYEPAKCIRCGLCVQLTATAEGPGLALLGRGLELAIGAPLDTTLAAILDPVAEACAALCPTGAITREDRRAPDTMDDRPPDPSDR